MTPMYNIVEKDPIKIERNLNLMLKKWLDFQ